jgi:hypothetical protein
MKKQLTTSEMVEQYIYTGVVQTETLQNGNYKRGNKVAKENNKIFELLKQNSDLAIQVLQQVMDSENDNARSIAAADALRLHILIEKSIAVLEKIADRDDIIGFGADMTLKIWRGEVPGKTL